MKRRKKQTGICPLCGHKKNLTREHAIPKCLFAEPLPNNMITVYTCRDCNKSYDLDEEYFRIYIAADTQPGSEAYELWFKKVIGSSVKRSPALRRMLLNDMDSIQKHHRLEPITFYSGEPVPDELVPNLIAFNANRIERVVEKIVRCLHLRHFGSIIPIRAKIDINTDPLSDDEYEKVILAPKGRVGRQGWEFLYWFGEQNNAITFKWLLLFHLSKHFKASVENP